MIYLTRLPPFLSFLQKLLLQYRKNAIEYASQEEIPEAYRQTDVSNKVIKIVHGLTGIRKYK